MDNKITNGVRRATELATNIAGKEFNGILGDYINAPDIYIEETKKGEIFHTPLGDKYMILSYIQETNDTHNKVSLLIEAPIINITRKKTVINTVVNGLDSSIFQITSNGDYNIDVKFSFITERTWLRKREDFGDFLAIANTKDELTINNAYLLNDYGIDKVVIESYTTTPNAQYSNVIDVSLKLKYVADYHMFDKYIKNGQLVYKPFK